MSDNEREHLLEKARKARRLASGIGGDPAGQKLREMAAEYEALAAQAQPKAPPPQATSQHAQQQQQPQPDPDKEKE
jgi:DNA uptake protein ComE-like DNA-binding protein